MMAERSGTVELEAEVADWLVGLPPGVFGQVQFRID
jgi:hypothetical protein